MTAEAISRIRSGTAAHSPHTAGYALLSPALILMAAMLVAPVVALVVLSFWTQTGFDIERTFTLANYYQIIEPSPEPTVWMGISFPLQYPIPAILMLKSLVMSLTATVAVILLAYPMAYFLAFQVTRYRIMWIILLTIPFWTSYLLRVFAWTHRSGLQRRHQHGAAISRHHRRAAGIPAL